MAGATLTDRVSWFFLAALGVVLIAYSLLLYLVARSYLTHHLDDELLAAFDTLVAAVEVESDDAKFEPTDHDISTRTGVGREYVEWLVRSERGIWVDHSPGISPSRPAPWLPEAEPGESEWHLPREIAGYRVVQRTLRAPAPKPVAERTPLEHEALTVTVAVSAVDTQTSLRWLAAFLAAASAGVWGLAAAVGKRFCRRVLEPVQAMARDAQQLTPADRKRLPVPDSGDELQELGAAFNGLLDRLHTALEHEQQFAGDVAHQLRTPLTVLLGQIEVARRRPRSTTEYQQLLEVLEGQTTELRDLIESLLVLARPEGQSPVERRRLDLAQWTPAHLARWSARPRGSEVTFRARTDEPAFAETLPVLLGQAIDNLVDNALKYSEPGDPVEVILDLDRDRVRITVEDQGSGIRAEDLPHLFEPFYRSPTSQMRVPGSGRGLPVVQRIAKTLGGEIHVESTWGEGSRFTLELPRATAGVSLDAAASS